MAEPPLTTPGPPTGAVPPRPVFARTLGWNTAGTLAGQVAGLAVNIVLARTLAPDALAAVLAGLAFAAIVSLACGLALDRVGVVAVTRADDRRGALAGGITQIAGIGGLVAAVISVVVVALSGDVFPWSASGTAVALVAVLAGVEVVRTAVGELPRAWLRVVASVVLGQSGRSVLVLVGLGVAAAAGMLDTASDALVVFVVASGALAGAAVGIVRKLSDGERADRSAGATVARGGGLVVVGVVSRAMIEQADVLIVAAAFDARAAAGYAIATRIANAVAGATAAINITVLPLLGRVDASRAGAVETLARNGATLGAIVVVPACLGLAVLASPVLEFVFGNDIAASAGILQILLVGQVVNALTGVPGAVLLDAGRHRTLLAVNLSVSLAVLVAELAVLTLDDPRWIAGVNVVGFGALNLAMWQSARRQLGVRCHSHVWPPRVRDAVLDAARS